MGAAIKWFAALIRRWLPRHADGHENLSIQGALAHGVISVIGEKKRFVGPHRRAVSALEYAFTPGADKIAAAIENDHRMLAARETIQLILAIHCHRRHLMKSPFVG